MKWLIAPRLALASLFLLCAPEPVFGQATLFERSGPRRQGFGRTCDLVGDTNGDGFGDFLVTAPLAPNGSLQHAGSVRLYSGFDGSLLATFLGAAGGDQLGSGASAAGDLNGDGFADLCLGTSGDNVPGVGPDAGSAQVISGIDGSVLYTFDGSAPGEALGLLTAPAGDVDGDGRDDLLVSRGRRSVLTLSGRDGSLLREVALFDAGITIVGAFDANGDGTPDLAALQELPGPGPDGGMYVSVFSGADGSELWRRGAGLTDASLASIEDLDGDGRDDVLIGSPLITEGAGRVRCHSGLDGTLLFEVVGQAGDGLGSGVAGAGDLDGDGHPDLAVGLPGHDGAAGIDAGAVRAYSGRTQQPLFTIEGSSAGGRLGARLSAGRDVNRDGVPDMIASAIPAPDSLMPEASVHVLSFVPHGLEPFGTGSPGCLGSSTLLAGGVPTLGASFELHAANTGFLPYLVVGDTEGSTTFLRALFHMDFAPPPPSLGIVYQAPLPMPDASGRLIAALSLPNDPALLGRTYVFQVASLFPLGACGQRVATSRGLRVTMQ